MNIPAFDAWLLGRIQAHDDLTSEQLDAVSDRWRPMAERLAELPLGERVPAFVGMLAAFPSDEVAALEIAIDSINTDGPPPPIEASESGDDSDGWGPLRIVDPPTVEPFPTDVFPVPVEAFCREVAESSRCPADFVGIAMLATAGTAIGQSVNIEIKRGWVEAPLLYAILVADPGKAKTPAIRAATRPLVDIDKALHDKSKLAREAWEERKKAHAKDDSAPPPGPEPPQLRSIVKDITRESLCLVLADNARGVLCSPDEATAWIGSWNQYKAKGTDEQFWLSLYSGDPVSVDRKGGRESVFVPHPFCSVIGGIQPDLLASLRDDRGRDNGLLDRIVFSYPNTFPVRQWTNKELSPEAERDWSDIIDRLESVNMRVVDDCPRPWEATFTPDARARFVSWFNANGQEMEALDSRAGALSKSEARMARLALILSRLRLASDPDQSMQDADGVPPVGLIDVQGAIRLTTYFASHLERAANRMMNGVGSSDAQALLNWIKRKQPASFREAEAAADLRRFRSAPETMPAAIRTLISLGAIRIKAEAAIPGKRGPKPSPAYDVHPDLLGSAGNYL